MSCRQILQAFSHHGDDPVGSQSVISHDVDLFGQHYTYGRTLNRASGNTHTFSENLLVPSAILHSHSMLAFTFAKLPPITFSFVKLTRCHRNSARALPHLNMMARPPNAPNAPSIPRDSMQTRCRVSVSQKPGYGSLLVLHNGPCRWIRLPPFHPFPSSQAVSPILLSPLSEPRLSASPCDRLRIRMKPVTGPLSPSFSTLRFASASSPVSKSA